MAPYAGFFYVYITALLILEGLVGVAFAVRSRAEASRKMAFLAVAYAWSAPLIAINIIALPGVPPDLPGEPLQVAPAIWLVWHAGWPLALFAYAYLPERASTGAGRIAPAAFLAALATSAILILAAGHLPTLITSDEAFTPLMRAGIAVVLVLDVIVIARLARTRATARDAWVIAAVAFAALEATLMMSTPVRFTTPYFLARVAGVASACAMLAALLADAFDVVRRAALQVAERERLAEMRIIADAMPQIVWRLGADGRNVYANARWSEYTGRPRVDGTDGGFLDAIHPDDRGERNDAFAAARAAGTTYEATYRLRGADGSYRYFLTRAEPIAHDGVVTGWIGTSTDIDDRKQLELRQSAAYEREHRVADRLQRASLPASLPRVAGLELDAVYQAGRSEAQIGGDWYDAFELDDGRVIVGVGDVMGSGLEAAVTMGAMRQAIRGAAEVRPDPVSILNAADRSLQKTQPDGLVTAFLGIIDPISGVITYASAGHPAPFVRRADGSISRLEGSGLPIGLRDEYPAEPVRTAQLESDALVVLYTDGLTEAQRDVAAGEARLANALARIVASERPAETLRCDVLGSEGSVAARDDIAILTIRLTAARRTVTDLRCDVHDRDAVHRVRRTVIAALKQAGLSEAAVFDADLVLGELLGNVVRHAPPIAEVRLDLTGAAPVLSVLDRGPGGVKTPALPDDYQQEFGRGLYLTSRLVADLSIGPRYGGGASIRATLRP